MAHHQPQQRISSRPRAEPSNGMVPIGSRAVGKCRGRLLGIGSLWPNQSRNPGSPGSRTGRAMGSPCRPAPHCHRGCRSSFPHSPSQRRILSGCEFCLRKPEDSHLSPGEKRCGPSFRDLNPETGGRARKSYSVTSRPRTPAWTRSPAARNPLRRRVALPPIPSPFRLPNPSPSHADQFSDSRTTP